MDFWFLFHCNAPQDWSGAAQMGSGGCQAAPGLTSLPQTRGIRSCGSMFVSISIICQSPAPTNISLVTRSSRHPPNTLGHTSPQSPGRDNADFQLFRNLATDDTRAG